MNYERLSSLFDDELSQGEKEIALDELMDDEQAQAFWQRMLIMRQSLRNELANDNGVLSKVRAELSKVSSIKESKER